MTFISNPNFAAEMETRSKALLLARARLAAGRVEALAHHAMPNKHGHPRIEVGIDHNGDVAVANTNHGAALEEWGGAKVKSPVYAPLRRGIRAAGFKLHES